MKHATPAALDRLEPLLQRLRDLDALKEKSRGVFYRGSSAFLHFHEDAAGLFADLRADGDWTRHQVDRASGQASLVKAIKALLAQSAVRRSRAPRPIP